MKTMEYLDGMEYLGVVSTEDFDASTEFLDSVSTEYMTRWALST